MIILSPHLTLFARYRMVALLTGILPEMLKHPVTDFPGNEMIWKETISTISNTIAMKIRNIATLNVRGISKDDDKFTLVEDAIKYKIDILTLSEEECLYELESENNSYVIYSRKEAENHHHGVGFLIKKELEPTFKRISERIATATIQMNKRKVKN